MKRSNFPGRRQKRQSEAQARNEAYASLSLKAKKGRNSAKVRAKLHQRAVLVSE